MESLGRQSNEQFFAIKDPVTTRPSDRKDFPTDLEQRLQQAWLNSQLYTSKSTEGEEKSETFHPARRIKKDLTSTLETLWLKSQQQNDIPVSKTAAVDDGTKSLVYNHVTSLEDVSSSVMSGSIDSSASGTHGIVDNVKDNSVDDWLNGIQAIEPVSITNEYMDEEFFRGLDSLNDAFSEFENLLPSFTPFGVDDVSNPDLSIEEYLDNSGDTGIVETSSDALPSEKGDHNTLKGIQADAQQRKRKAQSPSSDEGKDVSSEPGHDFEKLKTSELLMSIARGVAAGDLKSVQPQLEKLGKIASVFGNSTQRLSAYFLEGLVARASGTDVAKYTSTPPEFLSVRCGSNLMQAFEVLVAASPYLTFGHVACNSAILEAFKGHDRVHIIDFGLGHGIQWPPLIQALSTRPGGPPQLHITGVDLWAPDGVIRAHCVIAAGKRLQTIAKLWNVPLEYEAVRSKLEDVQPHQIHIHSGEVVAVNCALRLHSLLDESVTPSNPRSAVLRTIRALNPAILTIVEQNTNLSSPFFLSRFCEALHYYTAMFESIESSMPVDSKERRLFEQQVLGRAIVNVVACEGKDRVERHEPLGQWQQRVQRAGFYPFVMGPSIVTTVQSLLNTYKEGYELGQPDPSSLVLNWKGRPLLAMSAWKC